MDNTEMAVKIAEHEQRIIGAEHRIKDLEETQKQINDLTISVKELAISVKNMTEEQKDQGSRLKTLEEKPAKMWDSVSSTVVTGILGAVVGAIAMAIINLIQGGIKMRDWKKWIKCAGIRAAKTFAQTAVSLITVGQMVTELEWLEILGISATSAIVSLLTSVAGLPEVDE